jgi:uncharacterized protein YprB with RNaseH-like and TPR domain
MLTHTFCHLPKVDAGEERRLWSLGILSWDDCERSEYKTFPPSRRALVKQHLEESRLALERGEATYFIDRLPQSHLARVFPHFCHRTAFVDIETTGLSTADKITTIALYDGKAVKSYIRGQNLKDFVQDAQEYGLFVTFNGTRFDLPRLRRTFGARFDQAHLDLLQIMRAHGYRGGLKECEHLVGIKRQVPAKISGYEAVLLWRRYEREGDEEALRLLLLYNVQDVLSLEILLVRAYNMSMSFYPSSCMLPDPRHHRLFAKGSLRAHRDR